MSNSDISYLNSNDVAYESSSNKVTKFMKQWYDSHIDLGSIWGSYVRFALDNTRKAITERRLIIKESIYDFFGLDTNKDNNNTYIVILGLTLCAMFVYKYIKDTNK